MFDSFFFFSVSPQVTSFLSEAQFSAESPETLDPLFKFHETIAKNAVWTRQRCEGRSGNARLSLTKQGLFHLSP
ncbi:hypothetical protein PFLUV_G00113710 [Perca fluviatilis]|uniref:Uncharacterized protein n=1 Tax=Perca fluviatilis TaxID=8168 RepID=A0A6A5EZ00_PERFL|nr:hypothetical protein PFLUV_G00113710 [Perca fluviatilis]